MYRGFDLTLQPYNVVKFHNRGKAIYDSLKSETEKSLDEFIIADREIDASALQDYWFPKINADVFVSHSHNDLDMAIGFAGWLDEYFGLTCFIDSCIWNHCDKLLQRIDSRFTKNDDEATYNYTLRNYSTSHVHMMLSVALTQMIDKCECLFFLNTPESVSVNNVVENNTFSPWIYAEIATAKYIEKRIPDRLITAISKSLSDTQLRSLKESENFRFRYKLGLGHLERVNVDDMIVWEKEYNEISNEHDALKLLYNNHPVNSIIV